MNTQRSQIKKWDGTETTSWSNKSNLLPEKTKPQNNIGTLSRTSKHSTAQN